MCIRDSTQPHTLEPLDHRREPNQTLTYIRVKANDFWQWEAPPKLCTLCQRRLIRPCYYCCCCCYDYYNDDDYYDDDYDYNNNNNYYYYYYYSYRM